MLESNAVPAFVAHGPEQNAGTVDVPLHHTLHTVQDGSFIIRPVGQQGDPGVIKIVIRGQGGFHTAVGFVVSLIDDIEPEDIAQTQEFR